MKSTKENISNVWWLNKAVYTNNGIIVARCECGTRMVDFTDDDILSQNIKPGILKFPLVVPGPRPKSNCTSTPISHEEEKRTLNWLMNDCIGNR